MQMSNSTKIGAGEPFPRFEWPTVDGSTISPADQDGWKMLIVYRGKHCPLCKRYFKSLQGLLADFEAAGISVAAVSADPIEKARADVEAEGWRFPVGYDLSVEQMRSLGLYISQPRSEQETDRPFAEPGVFVINPEGRVHIVDISNAPFARPDLSGLLNGIKFVAERGYPIRGTIA
jgi:peroxiredoxin